MRERQREEKREKSVGKSQKEEQVRAHTSWWRDPCAVTSDVMMQISVIYLILNVRFNVSPRQVKI